MVTIYIEKAPNWEPSRGKLLSFPENCKMPNQYMNEVFLEIENESFNLSILTTSHTLLCAVANMFFDLGIREKLEVIYYGRSWKLNEKGFFEDWYYGLFDWAFHDEVKRILQLHV